MQFYKVRRHQYKSKSLLAHRKAMGHDSCIIGTMYSSNCVSTVTICPNNWLFTRLQVQNNFVKGHWNCYCCTFLYEIIYPSPNCHHFFNWSFKYHNFSKKKVHHGWHDLYFAFEVRFLVFRNKWSILQSKRGIKIMAFFCVFFPKEC